MNKAYLSKRSQSVFLFDFAAHDFLRRPGVITIYIENHEISVGKSNGTHHSIWSTSEIMGFWSKYGDAFLSHLLKFTVDVHTFCMLFIFC